MFCKECGREIPQRAKFCKYCGAITEEELRENDNQNEVNNIIEEQRFSRQTVENRGQAIKKKKRSALKWMVIGGAGVIIFALAIWFFFIRSQIRTIDMSEYIDIRFDGYDSCGQATVEFDADRFEEDYRGKIHMDFSKKEEDKDILMMYRSYTDSLDEQREFELFYSHISLKLDRSDGLANGESVRVDVGYNSELYKKLFHVQLKEDDLVFTVAGLTPIETFDPFENIDVKFSGISPNAQVLIEKADNSLENWDISFSVNDYKQLLNGDKVIVTATLRCKPETFAEKYGKLPNSTKKEYVVNGLMSYVTKAEDIPENLMNQIVNQGQDVADAKVSQDAGKEEIWRGNRYVGYYFLNKKPGISGVQNMITLVFEATVTQEFLDREKITQRTEKKFFYPVTFYNLKVDENGEGFVDLADYDITYNTFDFYTGCIYNSWGDEKKYKYTGYEKIEMVKNEYVTKYVDKYTYEDDIVVDENTSDTGGLITDISIEEENDYSTDSADYILPDSDSRFYQKSDLRGFTARDCMLARNELYARYGRKFKDEVIREYFESKDWYEGRIEPADFDEDCLNEYEAANRDLIIEYEKEQGYK